MNEHERVEELLPLYAAGRLEQDERAVVERHLSGCAACQADLRLWSEISGEIAAADRQVTASRALPRRALVQIRSKQASRPQLNSALQILRAQMVLVRREIWPVSALVMFMGYIFTVFAGNVAMIQVLAPLVAAACLGSIFGEENDPALELTLSTPTSPRQILLARLTLVFGYNLLLMLAISLAVLPFLPKIILSELILSWLAPMTFLSAAALALSLWIGTSKAITSAYLAWIAQLMARGLLNNPMNGEVLFPQIFEIYRAFWQNQLLLLGLSVLLLAASLWTVGRWDNHLGSDLSHG
jgi:hypothetical protein